MIVSHNELTSMVNKAFLGMQRHCGEADVIAEMVADLQMVGLNGVYHFNKASSYFYLDCDCAATITTSTESFIEVNFHNGSVACHLPAVLDLAVDKMVGRKKVTIVIHNCYNRWLAFSELVRLSSKSLAFRVQWLNRCNSQKTVYFLNKLESTPDIYFLKKSAEENLDCSSMKIEISVSDFFSETTNCSDNLINKISKEKLLNTRFKSLEKGIYVNDDEWDILKRLSTVFLIENSELSKLGAGGI